MTELWPIERRVLDYLDKTGPAHRSKIVADLAGSHTRTAHTGGRGSNGAAPLIMGSWCRRLKRWGWVIQANDSRGYYLDHSITHDGRRGLARGVKE